MTVTRFDGTTLPAGWSAVTPTGSSVTVGDGYASVASDAGMEFDSLSSAVIIPEGPRLVTPVSGAFDHAVAFANAAYCAVFQGFEVTAMDEAAGHGVRWSQYVNAITNRNTLWYAYYRDATAASGPSPTPPPTNLYGARSWLRMRWDGVDTWELMSSQTGKPGTWFTHRTITCGVVPTTFQIALTAHNADSDPRVMRVALMVDMAGRSDDATTDPGELGTTDLFDADLSGTSLPTGLTAQADLGGSVTVGGGHARMSMDTSTPDSYAWLLGPDNLPEDHGLLIRYRFPQPSVMNSFAAPGIRGSLTTDLPSGSRVLPDKYRPGTGLIVEVNGAGSYGDIVRLLTTHPVPRTADYGSAREFFGFSMLVEDLTSPIDGSGGDWVWFRMEAIGGYFRARAWMDGDPEPTAWLWEGEDHTQRGTQAAISWSHNDATSGGSADFDVDRFLLYAVGRSPIEFAAAADSASDASGTLAGAPPEPTATLVDTFTGTDNTSLTTHDPDIGDPGSWTMMGFGTGGGDSPDGDLEIINNELHTFPTGPRSYRNETDPGADEYRITATLKFGGSAGSRYLWLLARMSENGTADGDVDRYMVFAQNDGSQQWVLYGVIGGNLVQLDQSSASLAGAMFAVRVDVLSTGIDVYADDGTGEQLVLSTSDTQITARGRVGIGADNSEPADQQWIDDLTVEPIGQPVVSLAGVADSASDSAGATHLVRSLAGVMDSASDAVAVFPVPASFVGVMDSASDSDGTAHLVRSFAGVMDSASDAVGATDRLRSLAGVADSASDAMVRFGTVVLLLAGVADSASDAEARLGRPPGSTRPIQPTAELRPLQPIG